MGSLEQWGLAKSEEEKERQAGVSFYAGGSTSWPPYGFSQSSWVCVT